MKELQNTWTVLVVALVEHAVKTVAARPSPEATYRLQFHGGFTFADAARIVPYLRDLGISHCYASPYLKAHAGSAHGYDITDHAQLNPEVGTPQDYAAWTDALRERSMGQVLDIVPNHMAVTGNDNRWWNDVLENGPASPYAEFFDIDWAASNRPELLGRILVPTLGEPYGKVLEAGQLGLRCYSPRRGALSPSSISSTVFRCAPRTVMGRCLGTGPGKSSGKVAGGQEFARGFWNTKVF